MLDIILEQTKSPVARARLLSGGLQKNNRLEKGTGVSGDAGCLACGNCVDNCPVVRDKFRFITIQNQRTSMSLETLVGDECRRCYRCLNACPQVAKPVKEYALSFRRGEKIIHLLTAATIIGLASTGITIYHWGYLLPNLELGLLKWTHRLLGILLALMPLIFWHVDKTHMLATLKKATRWDNSDAEWIRQMVRHIKNPDQNAMPGIYQFNPAQKLWVSFLFFLMVPVLAISGLGQWFMESWAPGAAGIAAFFILLHMIIALCTDLLLLLHIYFKYVRNFLRTAHEIVTCYLRSGHFMYWTAYDATPKKGEHGISRG